MEDVDIDTYIRNEKGSYEVSVEESSNGYYMFKLGYRTPQSVSYGGTTLNRAIGMSFESGGWGLFCETACAAHPDCAGIATYFSKSWGSDYGCDFLSKEAFDCQEAPT